MATSAQQVIDRAVDRAALNDASLFSGTRLLQYITQFERRLYIRAAKLNPEYFGKSANTAARANNTDSWNIGITPGNIVALTSAEAAVITGTVPNVAVGTKINLVSRRFIFVEIPPRAYVTGRKVFGHLNELGADGSNFVTTLTLHYSPIPTPVLDAAQSLSLPDEFSDLVVLPLSRLFAISDRRLDEVPTIDQEFSFALSLFDEAIGIYTHGASKPIPVIPAVSPQDFIPRQEG